ERWLAIVSLLGALSQGYQFLEAVSPWLREPCRKVAFDRSSAIMARIVSKKTPRRGAAVVELALLLPFLLVVLVGIWEVGRLIQVQQALNNAAREGAGLAAPGEIINQTSAPTRIQVA